MSKQIIVAVVAIAAAHAAAAADVAAGAKLADAQCAACHGKDGKTPTDPSYPKLAGQYDDYLFKALSDYHSGARKNPIMGAIAKPLSKADMQNVAAYFASLPGPLTHRK
jgi:cytochrome c553